MAKETRLVRYDRQALTTYVYDGRLNLIEKIEGLNEDIVTRYRYDALNRLVAVEPNDGGTPRRFTYDAATRRLSSDGMLHFYGPGWETLADVDGGSLHARRIYVTAGGMDSQVAMLSKSEAGAWSALYYLRDHLGSVVALVDGSGAVVESYEYAPYGAPTLFDSFGDAIPTQVSEYGNRFLYTGREWEPGLGMYHFRYRTYSPYMRRFMQGDPIRLWGGWNYFAYVSGNPIILKDSLGLFPQFTDNPNQVDKLPKCSPGYYYGFTRKIELGRRVTSGWQKSPLGNSSPKEVWELDRSIELTIVSGTEDASLFVICRYKHISTIFYDTMFRDIEITYAEITPVFRKKSNSGTLCLDGGSSGDEHVRDLVDTYVAKSQEWSDEPFVDRSFAGSVKYFYFGGWMSCPETVR